ncbi:MAG: hypothetical protein QOK38_175 [Acidobacteriaceae bacterium]|jgi:hypothetical protein|nr:hypothetical protein [Acidobacteriaceae bacterium]
MIPDEGHANALVSRAEVLLAARKLGPALEYFQHAEANGADPNRCAAGRWMAHMLCGDFAAAWQESDAIHGRGVPDPHRVWNGEDISGRRVIVRCLHGFGDTVQFIRYAAPLNRRAEKVIWEVPPAMLQIARCFDGVDHVTTWGDQCMEGRDWDLQIEVMELPYIFRTAVADIVPIYRYLDLPSSMVRRAAAEMGRRTVPRIGVVWEAGSWNASRSMPVDHLSPLFERADCEFWNLQGGPLRQAAAELGTSMALRESAACNNEVLCLAGIISQLDLVLTVDTLAAHLAGSLGIPAWLMLQHAADWRWMEGRNDSPWYPSLRLFRQPTPGAWPDVIRAVGRELQRWLHAEEGRRSA